MTFAPPTILFSANQTDLGVHKDTVANVLSARCFGWSMATYALRDAVNASAEQFPPDVDEFDAAQIEAVETRVVRCAKSGRRVPLVKDSPVRFECELLDVFRVPGDPPMGDADVVIARVVGIHVDEAVLKDGRIDLGIARPLARLGYFEYCTVERANIFEMVIPGANSAKNLVGLTGDAGQHATWTVKDGPAERIRAKL